MNGQAYRSGYRVQGGLCSASAKDGGGSACESAAAVAMDKGRFEAQIRGEK